MLDCGLDYGLYCALDNGLCIQVQEDQTPPHITYILGGLQPVLAGIEDCGSDEVQHSGFHIATQLL